MELLESLLMWNYLLENTEGPAPGLVQFANIRASTRTCTCTLRPRG